MWLVHLCEGNIMDALNTIVKVVVVIIVAFHALPTPF